MSNQIKLSGIDASGNMLKIPKIKNYPFSIKPNFETNISDADLKEFLQNRLKLRILKIDSTSEEPVGELLPPIKAGSEIVFLMDTSTLDQNNLYVSRIAQSNETINADNFKNGDLVLEFSFQVVSLDSVDLAQVSAFSQIERLPQSLKEVKVGLKRSERENTTDQALWRLIRNASRAISFEAYEAFMNEVCGASGDLPVNDDNRNKLRGLAGKRFLPFTDTDSYRTVKVLTEFFLLVNCSANVEHLPGYSEYAGDYQERDENGQLQTKKLFTLPFYKTILNRLPDLRIKVKSIGDILDMFAQEQPIRTAPATVPTDSRNCYGILKDSLSSPCFIELIWSYWHEEAMLVQAMNAISLRFQNVRSVDKATDPLANLEITPLRPLNNLMWGYIQDEQHRLTVKRRAHEYDHHYGITLQGKAVPTIQSADSRVHFLEAFHLLLNRSTQFFKDDDDLTKVADGYTLLNALKEVHFILSEGMHNQYGDLPFTARVEMMSQQWLLARPELREFLPSRTMIAYPESWMGSLASMNNLQGWMNNSPTHFNTLAIYGEMLLLSIRFGNWNDLSLNSDNAANWARYFRPEIQGYIHYYRAVTGVDLTTPHPQTGKIDAQQPSFHLAQRAKTSANGKSNEQISAPANGKSSMEHRVV